MRQLISRLNDTTTHLDLGLDGLATTYPDGTAEQATWAYYASSKFAFLYHFFKALRDRDCCLAIVCKEGRNMDLLENYVKANKINHHRADSRNNSPGDEPRGLLRVILLPAGQSLDGTMMTQP